MNLTEMKEEYMNNHGGSFIQASRNKSVVKKAFQRQKNLSSIQRKGLKMSMLSRNLPSIP